MEPILLFICPYWLFANNNPMNPSQNSHQRG